MADATTESMQAPAETMAFIVIDPGTGTVTVNRHEVPHDGSQPLPVVAVRYVAETIARAVNRPVRARALTVGVADPVDLLVRPDGSSSVIADSAVAAEPVNARRGRGRLLVAAAVAAVCALVMGAVGVMLSSTVTPDPAPEAVRVADSEESPSVPADPEPTVEPHVTLRVRGVSPAPERVRLRLRVLDGSVDTARVVVTLRQRGRVIEKISKRVTAARATVVKIKAPAGRIKWTVTGPIAATKTGVLRVAAPAPAPVTAAPTSPSTSSSTPSGTTAPPSSSTPKKPKKPKGPAAPYDPDDH